MNAAAFNDRYDDQDSSEESRGRRDSFRVRRAVASRVRVRRRRKEASVGGGVHQRRNKHWSW